MERSNCRRTKEVVDAGQNHDTAEDLAQSALLQVLERLVQLRDSHRLLGWTWRVVQNTHRMSMRQSKFAPNVTVEFSETTFTALENQLAGPFEQLAEQEMHAALFQKIRELHPTLRKALELRVFEGKTTTQAAKCLGISKEAVRTRLVRARRSLRNSLDDARSSPAGGVQCQLSKPDLNAVLRQAAAAHGLQILAIHYLGQKVASEEGSRSLPRYALCEFIDPAQASGTKGVDAAFPAVIYRIDLLQTSSGWTIHATCGPATAAISGSGQLPDLRRGIETALTLLLEEVRR